MDGIDYIYMELRFGTVPMVAENKNRNFLSNSKNSTSVPHKFNSYKNEILSNSTNIITLNYDTVETENYIRDEYASILNNL